MSLSSTETLEVSAPAAPPGFSPLVRQRLQRLAPTSKITRQDLEGACGTPSAANQFLDKGVKHGYLVPVEWGVYHVPPPEILETLGRLADPLHRRLVSWSHALPKQHPHVLFAGPRLWRDTTLSVGHVMPIMPLETGAKNVRGATPQWNAFHMDIHGTESWQMTLRGEVIATWKAPSLHDLSIIVLAAADARWRQALDEIPDVPWSRVYEELRRLRPPMRAPAPHQSKSIGLGPPHRIRLLAPKWYMDWTSRNVQQRSLDDLVREAPRD